jgi:CDP-glycerol glycerophosphotransferase (TagB/SpsB family)
MFDFLLTDRPVFGYHYDLEDYLKNSRMMYYDLNKIFPGPISRTVTELIEQMRDLEEEDMYENKRLDMKKRFHNNIDGNSTQRAVDYLLLEMKLG